MSFVGSYMISLNISKPWIIGGDFNVIVEISEKKDGR